MYGYVNMIIYILQHFVLKDLSLPAIVISYTFYFEFMIIDMCIIQVLIFPKHLVFFYFTEKMNSNFYGTQIQRTGGGGGGVVVILLLLLLLLLQLL